jgi:hypothetical protein
MAKQTAEVKENVKKGREHYSHAKLDAKWAKMREQAEDRQEAHDKLSITQKIAKAKSRRGESKREIVRLTKQLAALKNAPIEKVIPEAVKNIGKKALTPAKSVVK